MLKNWTWKRKRKRSGQANWKIRKREQGCCAQCGQASGGHYRCPTCREKIREAQRERMRARRAAGIAE